MGVLAGCTGADEFVTQGSSQAVGPTSIDGVAGQQHYTPDQLARLWALSPSKVRRLFANEPGVIHLGESSRRVGRKLKRSYYTLRIPQTVAERVHRRLTCSERR
jgi:hypothetical protein